MHAVTKVRTPDELQNIYKELLKLKNLVSASFESKKTIEAAKPVKVDKS